MDKKQYHNLHYEMKKIVPKPELCEECSKSKAYDISNISGKYKKIISDWRWLCRKCHMVLDGRLKELNKHNFKEIKMDINLIKNLYFKDKLSITKIGDIFNVNEVTIYNRLKCLREYTGRRCAFKEKQLTL